MKLHHKNSKQPRDPGGNTLDKAASLLRTSLSYSGQFFSKPWVLLVLVFSLLTGVAFAQELEWAIQSGGLGSDSSQGIAVDGSSNSYVTGSFSDTAIFGAGEPNETSLTAINDRDVFVAKYNVDGILQWVRQAGGSRSDSIAVDDVGNSYVTGSFSGTANFGIGNSTKITLTANGNRNDIFVAKYSADGTLLWVRQTGGSRDDSSGGISVDGVGNSYVTGSFQGTAIFGAGDPAETPLISERSLSLFVAKYDPDGILLWARQTEGFADALSIAVDGAGHSYITGIVQSTVTFGAGEPKETALMSTGLTEIFVAKYDPDGRLHWAKQAVGTYNSAGVGVSVDAAGNSYVTGRVDGTATFGVGEPNETTTSGPSNIFVAKYTPDGALRWVLRIGGSDDDNGNGNGIAVDGAGNSYVTGVFLDTATFGAGELNETILTANGSFSFFVAKYGSDATLQWAKQAKGSNSENGNGIAVDSAGNSYVTGFFRGTAIFGVGEPNETTLTASGNSDMFVAKYTDSTISLETIDIQVNSSIDDAEEFPSGRVSLASRDLELVDDRGRNQTVGIRFNRVIIPQDATITKAYIQFQVEEENVGSTSLTIKGQAVDDAAAFSRTLHDISSRASTKALVNWNPAPWPVLGESGSDQRTPNIASIIQEITNRPGWSSGNSVAFMITGIGERSAESFDGDLKGAPVFHVEFSLP